LLFAAFNVYSQTTIFVSNGNYKYFLGVCEPDSNWYKPAYTDSSWTVGHHTIGYGNVNDSIEIDTVTSLYLRIKFSISSKANIKCANFFADYDDGFVAYLNGHEIARINLGKTGDTIPYNRLTDRSHEPVLYRNYFEPNGIYLDSVLLAQCLEDGENILSVQVHNDSVKGSDLYFNGFLFDLTNVDYRFWDSYPYSPNIHYNYYYKQVVLDSSQLPIVMINTNEYGIPYPDSVYIAHMGVINNGTGKYNKPTDAFTDFNGRIAINLHGNNSLDMPKKYYKIETQEANGSNLDVSLLSMPKDNDWILYGSFMDKTLIRNELAFTIGRKLGYYEPRTKYCNLFLNGEYQGVYILTEKIKRGKNRVNITKMYPQDISGVAVTGGYILNQNIVEYPKPLEIAAEQSSYIYIYVNDYYSVLDIPEYKDPVLGYKKYIDDQTLLDYVIANEFFKNCDSYLASTYFYKDRDDVDGRINFGPLWDNDLAFGNAPNGWQLGQRTDGWQFEVSTGLAITKILRDTSFANRFKNKWHNLRTSGFLSTTSLKNLIDSLANNVSIDREMNFKVWPIIDKDLYYNWTAEKINFSTTDSGAIENLKNWITQRTQWIDDHIDAIYYPDNTGINYAENPGMYDKFWTVPNPVNNYVNIETNISKPGNYSIQITDLNGMIMHRIQNLYLSAGKGNYVFGKDILDGMTNGIYILTISRNNNIIHIDKIVKL
jgi:hypothetical protein